MATVTSTIKETGGDYATIIAWEDAASADMVSAEEVWVGQLGRNTIESHTWTGSTANATYHKKLVSLHGKGRTGLFTQKDVVYGTHILNEWATIEDVAIIGPGDQTGTFWLNSNTTYTVWLRNVWSRASNSTTQAEHGFRNPQASPTLVCESCVTVDGDGAGYLLDGAGTLTLAACMSYRSTNGIYRAAGTATALNCFSIRPFSATGAAFTGTVTTTTCVSDDGSNSSTTVTEGNWARRTSRLSSLRAYGTFRDEPSELQGKVPLVCEMRDAGSQYGTLGGDAAIANDQLTGTTGGLTFDAHNKLDGVSSIAGAVRAFLPTAPVSRGLMQIKASGDNNNRIDFGVDSSGDLYVEVYDSSGSLDHTLTYTPDADQLAGEHTYGWRFHSGSSYLYLDGSQVATTANAVTRDSTDVLAVLIGGDGTNNLESGANAKAWGLFTGAAAPPELPLPMYDDTVGVFDDFRITQDTVDSIKNSGTNAGAPDLDAAGQPFQNPPSIGAYQYESQLTGDPDSLGTHGHFGHVVYEDTPGNTGWDVYHA